jgi:predicted outer membrane repeat protein
MKILQLAGNTCIYNGGAISPQRNITEDLAKNFVSSASDVLMTVLLKIQLL